jgi:thiopeptide-type bacteriocin biosynthesis protein
LLESISLGKRIIPRLPTAYNFQHNPLAIFQFLCDLQYKGLLANLTFDLEKLFPGLDFYPRVVIENVVISIARWRMNDDELKKLLIKPLSIGRLHLFRAERGIPRLVTLGLSDQQLVFDLGHDDEALFFLDCLRDTRPAVIREYLRADKNIESDGKPLAGQMIALLKRSDIVYRAAIQPPHKDIEMIQREFLPGSEWLYLKIYATPEAADRLLTSVVSPFLKKYKKQVQVWFFIRYRDPEPHIRLRIKTAPAKSAILLNALRKQIAQQESLVKDVKHEVYRREIERYSPELIEMVELLFQSGSVWVLEKLHGDVNTGRRRDIGAFDLICRMVFVFIPEAELISFLNWRSESFIQEFGSAKKLRVSLDSKYREYSREIQMILRDASTRKTKIEENDPAKELVRMMANISNAAQHWSVARRYGLLADLLHMQVNRMFNSRQREHEALIFYGLHKGCAERKARLKNNVSVLDSFADQ